MTHVARAGRGSRLLVAALFLSSGPTVCAWFGGQTGQPAAPAAQTNSYWPCSTPSPQPTVSPVPTQCVVVPGTPDPLGTPGPPRYDCTRPQATATPLPSATPWGIESGPFYTGMAVRNGHLRMSYLGARQGARLATPPGGAVWTFSFDTANEDAAAQEVDWVAQLRVQEVRGADGTVTQGPWYWTAAASAAAGVPGWTRAASQYAPGQERLIVAAVALPAGTPLAIGYTPAPVGGDNGADGSTGTGTTWFIDGAGPAPCAGGNPSGPVTGPEQGGAVWERTLPTVGPAPFHDWAGYPVDPNTPLTQGFGCTDFPELNPATIGERCPPGQPYYHSGIDWAAPLGSVLRSPAAGRVVFVGPTVGKNCPPGAIWHNEAPYANLGWAVKIRTASGLLEVFGHTAQGSQQEFGIQVGSGVTPGQAVAREGITGCTTGPHLHFMILDLSGGGPNPANPFRPPLLYLGANRYQLGGTP